MAAPVLALLLVVFSSHTSISSVEDTPPDCDNYASIRYHEYGTITFKYCKEGNKITYAEIVESKTTVKDEAIQKQLLKDFKEGELPPPPPPPPAPPVIVEEPSQISNGSIRIIKDNSEPLEVIEEEPGQSNQKVNLLDVIPPPPPPPPAPPVPTDGEEIFKVVEQMPRFPGCEGMTGTADEINKCAQQKMLEFIYSNLKYPKQARDNKVEGLVVVQFLVTKNGGIDKVKLVRKVQDQLDNEAVRVVKSMNDMDEKWIPGIQRGKNVNVLYTMPIRFKMADNSFKVCDKNENGDKIVLGKNAKKRPLFVVNGEKLARDKDHEIEPDNIKSIFVLKGEKAIAKYGEDAKDGVIEITLKKDVSLSKDTNTRSRLDSDLVLNDFSVSPNPASGSFRLQFSGEAGPIKVEVVDIAGRKLMTKSYNDFDGSFDETLSDNSFHNIIAYIGVTQGKKARWTKIVFAK